MSKVAFILGSGPRIGTAVAKTFLKQGYKVAIGKRNINAPLETGLEGVFVVSLDVTKIESVAKAFEEVETKFGFPNVVIYNIANLTFPPDPSNPFSVPPEAFEKDTAINVTGGYAALYATIQGFKKLDASLPKVFIATGNVTPFFPNPFATTLAAGKSALVQLIRLGDQEFKSDGYKFYFPSQVTPEGHPVSWEGVKAAAHSEVYWDLVRGKNGDNWDVRFSVDEHDVVTYSK